MTTPRRTYRVDVFVDADKQPHALIRRHPGALSWVWCAHTVRATSNEGAKAKALAAHQARCQDFEAEKCAYLTVIGREEAKAVCVNNEEHY